MPGADVGSSPPPEWLAAVSRHWLIDLVYDRVLDEARHCESCRHLDRWVEKHPWGEGYAEERMCECHIPAIEACPGVREELTAARQHLAQEP